MQEYAPMMDKDYLSEIFLTIYLNILKLKEISEKDTRLLPRVFIDFSVVLFGNQGTIKN